MKYPKSLSLIHIYTAYIESIKATDDYTVELKLTEPNKNTMVKLLTHIHIAVSYTHLQIIDAQLQGIDMESVVKEKSGYIVEKSIHEIQQEVEKGNLSYEEITAVCLYRIKTMDQKENGLNSVITINPDAMEEARNRDREYRRDQGSRSELYGIPVMLKDNINTAGMATSAAVSYTHLALQYR